MKLLFQDYQFDTYKRILTKNSEIVSLNAKQTDLLNYLLLHRNEIVTKEDILQSVWAEKVVSEQVVFQNISFLRALLGVEVVKTYPKRGYKWQLPVAVMEHTQTNSDISHDSTVKEVSTKYKQRWIVTFFIIVLLTILVWLVIYQKSDRQQAIFLDAANSTAAKLYNVTKNKNDINITLVDDYDRLSNFMYSPFRTWHTSNLNNDALLISIEPQPSNNLIAKVTIQGQHRNWRAYIEAQSVMSLHETIYLLINNVAKTPYFSTLNDFEAYNILNSSPQPKHLIPQLTLQLVNDLYDAHKTEQALTLCYQLLESDLTKLQRGQALLTLSKIEMRLHLWSESLNSINSADALFNELSIAELRAKALIESSWGHYVKKDFVQALYALNQAIRLARDIKHPLLETNALAQQSFLASKIGNTDLALSQVDLAQQIIELNELDPLHSVRVNYVRAKLAKTKNKSIPYYINIIESPYSPQYRSDFYMATNELRKFYIENNDWFDAHNTIKDWQTSAYKLSARAEIMFAQGEWLKGNDLAWQAYQVAIAEHELPTALTVATLILTKYQLNPLQDVAKIESLKHFILDNATEHYRSLNTEMWQTLNNQ